MSAEPGEDPAVANAANWLRLLFHVLTCNNPACVLEERCSGGKLLLSHILACSSPGACTVPSCTSVRRLTLHWLRCQDTNCRLCAGVWRDLSGNHEQQDRDERLFFQAQEHAEDTSPPEQPGTPDREDSPEPMDSTYMNARPAGSAVVGHTVSGAWTGADAGYHPHAHGGHVANYGGSSAPTAASLPGVPVQPANRAVLQLQEATAYMRYLLHSLMCKHVGDVASRVPGRQFWLEVLGVAPQPLLPQLQQQLYQQQQQYQVQQQQQQYQVQQQQQQYQVQQQQQQYQVQQQQQQYQQQQLGGGLGGGSMDMRMGMGAAAQQGGPAAAEGSGPYAHVAAPPAPSMAGRRLLMHRLTCANSFCALCAGTCELFTRGHALRGELQAPQAMRDMDSIVQELSLALGSINL